MEHDNPNAGQVRIVVDLPEEAQVDAIVRETLWAEDQGGGLYKVFNVPYLAYNINIGDVVRCEPGDPPRVVGVAERSGAQTFRVYFDRSATDDQVREVLRLFTARDAILEKANERVWAVGMRTVGDYEAVGDELEALQTAGVLEFESGFQDDMPFAPPP